MMKGVVFKGETMSNQVRRVDVTDPVSAAGGHDYADAFEVRLAEPDPHAPEVWVRAGLAATGVS